MFDIQWNDLSHVAIFSYAVTSAVACVFSRENQEIIKLMIMMRVIALFYCAYNSMLLGWLDFCVRGVHIFVVI